MIKQNRSCLLLYAVGVLLVCFLFPACSIEHNTSVKGYPAGVPFVFDTKVHVDANNLSREELKNLQADLPNYWADSMHHNRYRRYGFFYRINNPPVFDSANISRSIDYMNGYMKSRGYYHSDFRDTFYFDSTSHFPQIRTTVEMYINPGRPTLISSVGYDLNDSNVARIARRPVKAPFIVPDKTHFSKVPIGNELNRIMAIYRNNGYFKLNQGNLVAEVDTTDLSLLQLTLDPLEQALRMARSASRNRESPTATVLFRPRVFTDSSQLADNRYAMIPFRVGHVYFYPETNLTSIPDSILLYPQRFTNVYHTRGGHITIYNEEGKFKPRPLLDHFYLRADSLYQDVQYYRTVNNLSSIGAWQQVDVRAFIHPEDSTVDLHFFLVPAIKQNITVDFEVSRNTGDYLGTGLSTSSNINILLGLGLNLTYRNRNAWKQAIQSTTSLSNGVELNIGRDNASRNLFQTLQSSIGQTYVFPRFITPFRIRDKVPEGIKSVLSVNAAYQDRRSYYRLSSVVGNWGYEWRSGNKLWQYRPINVEVYRLAADSLLDSAFKYSPYLRNAFNTGTVVSQQLTMTMTYSDRNNSNNINFVRIGLEEAGSLLGRIKGLNDKIYQYVKLEAEYRKQIALGSTQLALRAYSGIGYNYYAKGKFGQTLPFFKQFIGGGPNSMRAWGLRQIGLGSSLLSDTSGSFRDRYGDMKLEANAEYRYPMFVVGSMKVNGAVFVDAGNIWNLRYSAENPEAQFKLDRIGKDLAIGIGTGIRLDFDYFLIRLDMGLKLKDPARLENSGWMSIRHFTWQNREYQSVNPLTGQNIPRNNYALQLGINLPF